MQFGHFDDAKKEYVITSPKTPLPWIIRNIHITDGLA